jgi:hypothetical protein
VAKPKPESMTKAIEMRDNTEPPIDTINGITPGSVQEWRVALALRRMKVSFEYQKPVFGGRGRRGGQMIDFWVYTVPLPTPVYVQGSYWHRRSKRVEDQLSIQAVKRAYSGQILDPVELPEEELDSVSNAINSIRRRLVL